MINFQIACLKKYIFFVKPAYQYGLSMIKLATSYDKTKKDLFVTSASLSSNEKQEAKH